MGKHDPLSLYHAVMGELWEEEHRRAGAARDRASARQARSYKRAGRSSVRNVTKASQGSRAAVFKRIRAGGCKTRRSLGNQLDYVNDKAVFTFSSQANSLDSEATLSEDQKAKILDQWTGTWRGSSKLGFTSHMLLSFPTDVSADQVRDIALDWCEHFFESGYYGDEWDYVVAVHTDRDHPHAHILLNNRGKDQGLWFSCWAEGVMSPQLMREKQAEIAENYGVALDATTRLERGIFAKPAGLEEIYAAKSEGRSVREIALSENEASIVEAAVIAFAKEYENVADVLDRADASHLAAAVRLMAGSLAEGSAWVIEQGDFDLAEIKTVGEAIDYAEARIDEIRDHAEKLEQPERTGFELRAAPAIASLSQLVPDPELRTAYNQELAEPYPPGSDVEGLAGILAGGERSGALDGFLHEGQALGLNTDELQARMEAGGTRNHGLAQDWVERDLTAILSKDGIVIGDASVEQLDAAVETLDAFQMRLSSALGDALEGVMQSAFADVEHGQLGLGQDRVLLDDLQELASAQVDLEIAVQQAEDPGLADAGTIADAEGIASVEEKEPANAYIRQLAQDLRNGELSGEQQEMMQRTLVAELHKELGDEGMAELDRGHWQVLDTVLPTAVDQISVTQEYLEIAAEDRGEPALAEIASDLTQVRANERAQEISAENAAEYTSETARDRGLDDDLGL
ncbi:relaxase/mobilization nuclease domain-containing protein [Pseudophaeobacter sp.]|uniref:relaxase/mobilization nuclease domain-containing protein n=1 Tax=Pseudophaeobacter sp. TaxID=1971739 RepID=UPI00405877C0